MNIVVTGAQGFIGKNLCLMLSERGYDSVAQIERDTPIEYAEQALLDADFVFHLAGINRPKNDSEFTKGNKDFTKFVIDRLAQNGRKTPIMLSSSTQASLENAYGVSKAQAESLVRDYGRDTGSPIFIYRFPNVFGKWCKPNYNSFVATFCHNIANDIEINVHDPDAPVTLVYIDDLCYSLISLLDGTEESGFKEVAVQYDTTVGKVATLLEAFKNSRDSLTIEHV
ncbi:NAD-dependent epimerase/dehydratase family protein, partial [Vibrio alfacsensis]